MMFQYPSSNSSFSLNAMVNREELKGAAERGDLKTIKALMSREYQQNDLQAALKHASTRGHTEVVQFLCEHMSQNSIVVDLNNPLQYAAEHGYLMTALVLFLKIEGRDQALEKLASDGLGFDQQSTNKEQTHAFLVKLNNDEKKLEWLTESPENLDAVLNAYNSDKAQRDAEVKSQDVFLMKTIEKALLPCRRRATATHGRWQEQCTVNTTAEAVLGSSSSTTRRALVGGDSISLGY